MPTYRLDVAYDGSGFHGYAAQTGQRTIQGELESALAKLVAGGVETAVAGRTDAGVHARGQVVSFETDGEVDVEQMRRSLNSLVGPEVSVLTMSQTSEDFHARFSAKSRRYRYLIDPRPFADPMIRHMVWHVGRDLDVESMSVVVDEVVGEHDFSSFCRSVEGRSNVRRVSDAELVTEEGLLAFWIEANAFCHQMVRSLVGYMYDIGRGFSSASEARDVIQAKDRSRVATVAPPRGLTLWEVRY